MKLDYSSFSHGGVLIWDDLGSRRIEHVQWVDADAGQYSIIEHPFRIVNNEPVTHRRYAKLVVFFAERVVIVNPRNAWTPSMAASLFHTVGGP